MHNRDQGIFPVTSEDKTNFNWMPKDQNFQLGTSSFKVSSLVLWVVLKCILGGMS